MDSMVAASLGQTTLYRMLGITSRFPTIWGDGLNSCIHCHSRWGTGEICEKCGGNNPHHAKRWYGISKKQWERNMRAADIAAGFAENPPWGKRPPLWTFE